jgi:hypothetical protein
MDPYHHRDRPLSFVLIEKSYSDYSLLMENGE